MLITVEKCSFFESILSEAADSGILQFVLKNSFSFCGFFAVIDFINNVKIGKEFDVDDKIFYIINRDLNDWKNQNNQFNESISVTIKGFNTIEEAEEFCNWYSGEGEQVSCGWFDCRKSEGIINSSNMDTLSVTKTSNENIEMILKMI